MGVVVSLPGETLKNYLGSVPTDTEFVEWDVDGPAPRDHIDLVVLPYMGARDLTLLGPVSTGIIQSQSIGYDGIAQRLPAGKVFANAATVHEASTAELTVGLIVAQQRGIPEFVRAASEGRWAPERRTSVADRNVTIIGAGGVGNAIADRLLPFEVTVTRVGRSARTDDRGTVYPMTDLPSILPSTEILVVVVPLDESTHRLIDSALLRQLPDGALVVNVARGPVADTEAILAEARSGRLRFALDVTDPEPLPQGHELFGLPNVLISPHVGGATSAMMPRMGKLITEQIERLSRGEDPLNVVIRS